MLKTRIITGAVLSVIIATVLIFSHIPWVLNIAVAALCVQAIYELYNASELKEHKWLYCVSYAVAVGISFIEIPKYIYVIAPFFAIAVFIFAELMINVDEQKRIPLLIPILLALTFSFFYKTMSYLRQMSNGVYLLGGAILVTVITDIAAYFIGRHLGKHKLAPVISPKKTIEGSIGGTLFSSVIVILIACVLQHFGVFTVKLGMLILYTITASVVGQFGDLALSSIKRIVGIKDYGKLLPGHGGILDRFDSMLFVMPFTYLFCTLCGTMIY